LSVFVSTHLPAQLVLSPGQAVTQVPPSQVAPAAQVVSQLPQCAESVVKSTQRSPHAVRAAVQAKPHMPASQTGAAPAGALQMWPHLPQFELSFWTSVHEPPQFEVPAAQLVRHAPLVHTASVAQAWSHEPQ
jgi:hypothetical protein